MGKRESTKILTAAEQGLLRTALEVCFGSFRQCSLALYKEAHPTLTSEPSKEALTTMSRQLNRLLAPRYKKDPHTQRPQEQPRNAALTPEWKGRLTGVFNRAIDEQKNQVGEAGKAVVGAVKEALKALQRENDHADDLALSEELIDRILARLLEFVAQIMTAPCSHDRGPNRVEAPSANATLEKVKRVVRSSKIPIGLTDNNRPVVLVACNNALEQFYGVKHGELKGKNLDYFLRQILPRIPESRRSQFQSRMFHRVGQSETGAVSRRALCLRDYVDNRSRGLPPYHSYYLMTTVAVSLDALGEFAPAGVLFWYELEEVAATTPPKAADI